MRWHHLPIGLLLGAKALSVSAASQTTDDETGSLYEFVHNHRLATEVSYGPSGGIIGGESDLSFGLRYEPTLIWFVPQQEWSDRFFLSRFWLSHLEQDDTQLGSAIPDPQGINDSNIEWREFYWQENRLFGNPEWAMKLGRQRYQNRFGYWWDTSLESINFSFDDGTNNGLIALGQRFSNYTLEDTALEENEKDIALLFARYTWQWRQAQHLGFSLLHEQDYSGQQPREIDGSDVSTTRLGLAAFGEADLAPTTAADYHIEAINLSGKRETILASDVEKTESQDGWLVLLESGLRFQEWAGRPRLSLMGALTNKPLTPEDGFYFNPIQSDRFSDEGYTDGLFSRFTRLNGRNFALASVKLEVSPFDRSQLSFKVASLQQRSASGALPIQIAADVVPDRNEDHIGNFYQTSYVWDAFPRAVWGRQTELRAALHLGYFEPGDALPGLNGEFHAATSINIVL